MLNESASENVLVEDASKIPADDVASPGAGRRARGGVGAAPVAALVVGIVGVAAGWVPLAGRFVALACGAVAVICACVGLKRRDYPASALGRYGVSVAGLTLGCVCLFEGLRALACTSLVSMLMAPLN